MSHSFLAGVQSPQVMTSVSTPTEWTSPRGLHGWVPEALLPAHGQAPMKKAQDGCRAQRDHVMNRRTRRLTVSITTEPLEPRCGVLIVRVICWWLAVVTALSRYCAISVCTVLSCASSFLNTFLGETTQNEALKLSGRTLNFWQCKRSYNYITYICFVRFGVCCLAPKSTCHVMATLAWRNSASYSGGKDGSN